MKEKMEDNGVYECGIAVVSWAYFFVIGGLGVLMKCSGKIDWNQFGLTYGIVLPIFFCMAILTTIMSFKYRREWMKKRL